MFPSIPSRNAKIFTLVKVCDDGWLLDMESNFFFIFVNLQSYVSIIVIICYRRFRLHSSCRFKAGNECLCHVFVIYNDLFWNIILHFFFLIKTPVYSHILAAAFIGITNLHANLTGILNVPRSIRYSTFFQFPWTYTQVYLFGNNA